MTRPTEKQLAEALEPFTKAAEYWQDVPGVTIGTACGLWQDSSSIRECGLTVGDVRKAAAVLAAYRSAQQAEPKEDGGFKVVTWNTKTDRIFPTKQEATDYITMNDADGDWHIEPCAQQAEAGAAADPRCAGCDIPNGCQEYCRCQSAASSAQEPWPGWAIVHVNSGFPALMEALDRASRKGYMPDAMSEEWAAFEYHLPFAAPARLAGAAHGEADAETYRAGFHAALTALGEVVDWSGAEGFKQEWLGWLQSNADSMPEGSIEQLIDAAIAARSAKPGETR